MVRSSRLLSGLVVLAVACGDGTPSGLDTSAPSALRAPASVDVVESDQVSTGGCESFIDRLVGASNMYDAEFETVGQLVRYPMEPIGPRAADLAEQIVNLRSGTGTADLETGIELLQALDAETFESCGVPGAAALFLIIGIHAHASACEGAGPSAGLNPPCGESVVIPTELPCFVPHPDGGYAVAAETVEGGWQIVDCDSRDEVTWDAVSGEWRGLNGA